MISRMNAECSSIWVSTAAWCGEKKEKDEEMVPWKSNLERKEKERKKMEHNEKAKYFPSFSIVVCKCIRWRLNGSMTTTTSSELSIFWLAPLYSLFQFDFRIITVYWMRVGVYSIRRESISPSLCSLMVFRLTWINLFLLFTLLWRRPHLMPMIALVPSSLLTNNFTQIMKLNMMFDFLVHWLHFAPPTWLFFPLAPFSFDPSRSPYHLRWNEME